MRYVKQSVGERRKRLYCSDYFGVHTCGIQRVACAVHEEKGAEDSAHIVCRAVGCLGADEYVYEVKMGLFH